VIGPYRKDSRAARFNAQRSFKRMKRLPSILLIGFNRDGGTARVTRDGRWLYMLDSRGEGDLWMASRDPSASSGAEPDREPSTGATR
jgi:hypothetical protein